ncbi:2-hydroxyglutaryl-CoA dehydratase D-component [Desulfatibacillum aliphaticivorans]|uniref:2-hydroxyglutaryl-CoA dehydratase D-component n=1 Tax=Desulfatibacillum aliphaticivorans TaxID=218208 RepID=B8F9Y5_DESAL|nr:double-cubane-cluster-containing anaerobic reductase [Desulfatibacillum aliphaticivorans]ACL03081.1 2-hydroxyglutaryl-CoA dehydratase D-component [Desulfatibacillum aliphaticivorans]
MIQKLLTGFDNMPEQSLASLEEAREEGRKVVGIYCIFAPVEMIRAAGALPVGLCGKKQEPIAAAEAELPANLCPLIKSSYGFAATDTCPFFAASDAIVGETTCDGKKKMYEIMQRLKPVHLMHLPYDPALPHSLAFWRQEVNRFGAFLEELTGVPLTVDELNRRICIQNRVRKALRNLHEANLTGGGVRVTGLELLKVLEAKNFWADQEQYAERLEALVEALKDAPALDQTNGPRILLTGTPIGKGSDKVLRLIEQSGATVIAMENCTSLKAAWTDVEEDSSDPLDAIARRYLNLPCACLTPNEGRAALIRELAGLFRADAVVDLTWHACHTYMVEAQPLGRMINNDPGLPVLHLCTDYGESDLESLRTRIEAFLEII